MRWEKVEVKMEGQDEKGPGKRWGHTCNAVKGGSFLYLFGGYGKHNSQTNQVHVFDTLNQTWSEPVIKGSPPTPRDSHTCTAIGDNLFVFGGTDGVNPLKDLHMLDISSHTWISPTIRGDGPEAREGHSAAVVGKRIFIFGGCGKSADNDNEVYYNDLYILNTETFVWKCATTSGTPPSPRDSHSCSSWKNKIIVIGGEDGHDYYLSDVHILDTDTLIWRELTTSGQLLPPRAGHSTVSFGKNLFVFGGFTDAQNLYNDLYMLDIDTGVWTNVTTITNSPCARFSVAGDCVDPIKGGVLVFIGGCNKSLEALDDMYYLYTGMTRESGQRPEKLSLRKQLKLKCQEQNLNPVQNDVLVRYGVSADMRPPMTVLNCSQPSGLNIPVNQPLPPPGKKMFEAKVTKNIFEGYAIETVIDGKPLRGILFSNKPSSLPPSAHTSTRKRTAEIGSITPNGAHTNMSKTPKVDELKNRHAVHGDSSESHEHHCIEAVASLPSSNPTTADASLPSRNPTTADASLPSWNPTTADVSLPSSNPTTDVASLPSSNPTTADASLQSSNPTTADASLQSSNPTTADASLQSSNPTTAVASLPSSNPTTADASLQSSNPTTADASLPSSNPTTADASVIHKDSVNREPEVAYLNQIDGGKYETPKFLGGNLKNDGANDVASSTGDDNINDQTNVSISMPEVPRNDNRNDAPNCNTESSNPVSISMPEVPRHDDRNDAPNCNTESSNPVATESAACLSNQGVMMDSTSARTEENSEAAKLT